MPDQAPRASEQASGQPTEHAPGQQGREFAAAFRMFLDWVNATAETDEHNEVSALVRDFLTEDGGAFRGDP